MSFPANPSNNQVHRESVVYRYSNGVWARTGTERQIAHIPEFLVTQNAVAFSGASPWVNIGRPIPPGFAGIAFFTMYWTGGTFDLTLGNVKTYVELRDSSGTGVYSDYWNHPIWDSYTVGAGHGLSFVHSFVISGSKPFATEWRIRVEGNAPQGQSGDWRDQRWSADLLTNDY